MRILRLIALATILCTFSGCHADQADLTDPATESDSRSEVPAAGPVADLLQRAEAERGDIQAQYTLGVLLGLGLVSGGEASEAIDWYRRVAEQGDADCKFHLGELYWTGSEAKQVSSSVQDRWIDRLSRLGDPTTPLRVGGDYPMGSAGLTADAEEAFSWFSAAAAEEHVMAWRRLAEMRLKGQGTERSLAHAHMWFSLLAEQGLGNSGIWLTTVRGEMTEAEVAESVRLLEAFRSRSTTGR